MVRILVVDDELQVAGALRRLLRREGFDVEVAHSGEEALDKLPAFRADLVISDFQMKGMNGAELLSRIVGMMPSTVRVLLSGCVDPKSSHQLLLDGAISFFISKPWDDDALVDQVRKLLGGTSATPSA